MALYDYDAVVVGAGPNGLAAAIALQQQGLSVLLVEGKDTVGGGMRSAFLTLPGYVHDVCSAVHPLGAGSPFFSTLGLEKYGLEYLHPPVLAAHPLEDGTVGVLKQSLTATAALQGADEAAYLRLFGRLHDYWPAIARDVLGPLRLPHHPLQMAHFGVQALRSSLALSRRFRTKQAKALWAGLTAHSMLPLSAPVSSAIGLVLTLAGHQHGWPVPKGGSQSIAQALAACFTAMGGKIQTGFYVKNLQQLPSARAVLFDVSPAQLLQIAGYKFSAIYRWQLARFRYGMGVFKIDWALDGPVPFTAAACRQAGTVHLGNTIAEVAAGEQAVWQGKHPEKPFVLLAQQGVFDTTRAPGNGQPVWAYCHVPNGSIKDMTVPIEAQVERFAPGFRDRILDRHTMNTEEMELYNPNYIGGDINGGVLSLSQLFTRPALRFSPYRTSAKGLYLCSASTPPGGGVHGLCGYHAAKRALKDVFKIQID